LILVGNISRILEGEDLMFSQPIKAKQINY